MPHTEMMSIENAVSDKGTPGISPERRVALWMTQEEADAFLTVLLNAPPTSEVPGEITERLLCRVANAHRAFERAETPHSRVATRFASAAAAAPSSETVRRVRAVRRRCRGRRVHVVC